MIEWMLLLMLLVCNTSDVWGKSMPLLLAAVPGVPHNVRVLPNSEDSLRVQFEPPLNVKPQGSNGLPVTGYKIDVTKRINSIHQFKITASDGTITGGTYKLQFQNSHGTSTTRCLPWDVSEIAMELALEECSNVDGVAVTRSELGSVPNGYTYSIEFNGEYLVNGDQSTAITYDLTGCTAFTPSDRVVELDGTIITAGIPDAIAEKWFITSTGDVKMKGTFELSMGFEGILDRALGGVTVTVAAGSKEVVTTGTLKGLINAGDRISIGGEEFKIHARAAFTDHVFFLDSYHTTGASGATSYGEDNVLGNVIVTSGSSQVVYDGDWITQVAAGEMIRIGNVQVKVSVIITDLITLTANWPSDSSTHITAYKQKWVTVSVHEESRTLKEKLESLPAVGQVIVQRQGPDVNNGYVWTVTFTSLGGSTACPSSPCFVARTTTTDLTDVHGDFCTSCAITTNLPKVHNGDDGSSIERKGVAPLYESLVLTQTVAGSVFERQSITVTCTEGVLTGHVGINFRVTTPATLPIYFSHNEPKADMRQRLRSLPTIGDVSVEKETISGGFKYTIDFLSNVGDLPLLTVQDITTLSGTGKSVIVVEEIKGTELAYEAILSGLQEGEKYSVRVSAKNGKGYGSSTDTMQLSGKGAWPLYTDVLSFPRAITLLNVRAISSSQIGFLLQDTNSGVTSYQIETSTDPTFGTAEVKKVSIFNTVEDDTVGTFKLKYGDQTSHAIAFHATASEVQLALNLLFNLNGIVVSRMPVILTGTALDKVEALTSDTLTCTALSTAQATALVADSLISVGPNEFFVKTQPSAGDTVIYVKSGHLISDFSTQNYILTKVDSTGTLFGPKGNEWLVTFSAQVGPVATKLNHGLQMVPSILEVSTGREANAAGGTITAIISDAYVAGIAPAYYSSYSVSANDEHCNSYVVGQPSSVQVLRLMAETMVTAGGFKLQLDDQETANCIKHDAHASGGSSAIPEVSIKVALESLSNVHTVAVAIKDEYKKVLLTGSAISKVTAYDGTVLTVESDLTTTDVGLLESNTLIRVSRNLHDASSHSCDLQVDGKPASGQKTIDVFDDVNCVVFTAESRSLSIFTMKDYEITFMGQHPYGTWPTLKVTNFGVDDCLAHPFEPSAVVKAYWAVHSVHNDGSCAHGNVETQTIIADGTSVLGGTFTVSYQGYTSNTLAVATTTAAVMKSTLDAMVLPGTVSVTTADHGTHGKAWHVTFVSDTKNVDIFSVSDAFVSGANAVVNVYPTVTFRTLAAQDNIRGTFRIHLGDEVTERIGYGATDRKIITELRKLRSVGRVDTLGFLVGDTGLELQVSTTISSNIISSIKSDGDIIDPSLFVSVGDSILIDVTTYIIELVSGSDITLNINYAGTTGIQSARVGQRVTSKKTLPGVVSMPEVDSIPSSVTVVSVTSGSNEITMSSGHGFITGDTFSINGQILVATNVVGNVVTMDVTYNGDTISSSNPLITVYQTNIFKTSNDLSGYLDVGDKMWLQVGVDKMDEFVVLDIDTISIKVSGVFTAAVVAGTAYHSAHGNEWSVVFKSVHADLNTIQAIPEVDWRGTDARLRTIRPEGTMPLEVIVGNLPEIQTLTLSAASTSDIGSGKYTLSFSGETTGDIEWNGDATDVKNALELLDTIQGVTVETATVGNGYVHTITIWGQYSTPTLPLMTSTLSGLSIPANCDAVHQVLQRGVSDASSYHTYQSLSKNTAQYVRVSAMNSHGNGPMSIIHPVTTANIGTLPSVPTGVTLGDTYGSDWLEVRYRPPHSNGGSSIRMYRIEWDASENFDSTSPYYGSSIVQQTFEVQRVTTVFRSNSNLGGSFTLSWGGSITTDLAFDISTSEMETALKIITGNAVIGDTSVKVTKEGVSYGNTWSITFANNLGDISNLMANGDMLEGDFPTISVEESTKGNNDLTTVDYTYEVQDVYTRSASTLTGTFILSFEGKKTTSISVDASALEMELALQTLTSLHSVKVTKTVSSSSLNTAVWTITFANLEHEMMSGAGNIHLLQVSSTSVTGVAASVYTAEKIAGTKPFRFDIHGLTEGKMYYARVMAYNAEGFGSASSPMAYAIPQTHPGSPTSVSTAVVDGTSLLVSWNDAVSNGGVAVDSYKVEWFTAQGTIEKQTITTSAENGIQEIQSVTSFADTESISGFFRLSFDGEDTENIEWDAQATGTGSVQERLQRLSTIGTVEVTREYSKRAIGQFYVTVSGNTVTRHVSSGVDANAVGLSINDMIWIADIECTLTATPSTATTIAVDHNFVTATTGPLKVYKRTWGYTWTVTFDAGHVGKQSVLEAKTSNSWAGVNPGLSVQVVRGGLQPISGTFRLSMSYGGITHTTPPIAHDITAEGMKKSLEELSLLSLIDVSRSNNGYGYNWIVTFPHELKSEINLLTADPNGLTGPSAGVSVSLTRVGEEPVGLCQVNGSPGTCTTVTSGKELTIASLTKGQSYIIRVRAHNPNGWGPAGYSSSQTPRNAPGVPTNVVFMTLSSTLLKVVWEAPADNGGSTIIQYKIEWDTDSNFANTASPNYDYFHEMVVSSTDTSPFYYNIPVTIVATPYYARIVAVNDIGRSLVVFPSPSSLTPVNTFPGPPQDVTLTVLSSYGLLLTWSPPTVSLPVYGGDGGQPISQYMVEWDTSADFDSPADFALVSNSAVSYTIGGHDILTGVTSNVLVPGSVYYVRISAFNSNGAGPVQPSTLSSATTSDQLPGAPQSLSTVVASATSALASWTTPSHDGGQSLQSYVVEWDSQSDFLSGQSGSAEIPIVREMQSLSIYSSVTNEVQNIEATVEVTNERQTVRATVTGLDEIQIIRTTNDAVVDEVQTITTSATDRNEVQEIRLTANDVNEIQQIQTDLVEVMEEQRVVIGATRVNEIQTFTITLSGTTVIGDTTGSFKLQFDTSTSCTYCAVKAQHTTVDIDITDGADTGRGITLSNALNNLANIDTVVVTRTTAGSSNLVVTYTITFTGDGVAGDVPLLSLVETTLSHSAIFSSFSSTQNGNEPKMSSSFTLGYTCEAYSDPSTVSGLSLFCDSAQAIVKSCNSCATTFSGHVLTVTIDLELVADDRIRVANCVLQVISSTTTQITVVSDDVGVGQYCTDFTGGAYSVSKITPSETGAIPIKSSTNVFSASSVIESALEGLTTVGSVTVLTEVPVIDSTFIGIQYDVTFVHRTGTLPLMTYDLTLFGVTNTAQDALCPGLGCSCEVTRETEGKMIYGTFTLGLPQQSDGVTVDSAPIRWDASELEMKTILESTGADVFGDVTVTRTAMTFSNKWSGGYTWTITFTGRGWNIVPITMDSVSLLSTDGSSGVTLVHDTAGEQDGNEISGAFDLTLDGVTANIILYTHTLSTLLTSSEEDTVLKAQLETMANIADVTVNRSAATQAKGFTWTVTFTHQDNGGDVPEMTVASSSLVGTNVQINVYETVQGNQLAGEFSLTYDGQTTGAISFSSSAVDMQTQLNSLSSISPSSVEVTRVGPNGPTSGSGTPGVTQVLGYVWFITFRSSVWADPTSDHSSGIVGNWKGTSATWDDTWASGHSKSWGKNVGALDSIGYKLSCIDTSLTTTDGTNSETCAQGVATAGVSPLKGSFTITLDSSSSSLYMSNKVSATSGAIDHNAWATAVESGNNAKSVEEVLESMANVGDVTVSRSAVDTNTGGYIWTVTFIRDVEGTCEQVDTSEQLCNAPGDVPLMTTTSTLLLGSTPSVLGCDGTNTGSPCDSYCSGICQDGVLLRGDFLTFHVSGDPGHIQGCALCVTGRVDTGGNNDDSVNVDYLVVHADAHEYLYKHLVVGDRLKVGTTNCIFTVRDEASPIVTGRIYVDAVICSAFNSVTESLNFVLPWNAEEDAVSRALSAASDEALEVDIWSEGRKVDVQRTVVGKYGEVSWLIRFVSNPTFTPPGAGDINDIVATSSDFTLSLTTNTPGSDGLSGTFTLDLHSSYGPRIVDFDEPAERLRRKLMEMSTIVNVFVERSEYPSSTTGCASSVCSGGWGYAVDTDGTRGGYRWSIFFLNNPGIHLGESFPRGSGDVDTLTKVSSLLAGSGKSVDVYEITKGSTPISGTFKLEMNGVQTPSIPFSASANTMEQSIESLPNIGQVSVTQEDLMTDIIPNAVASISQDGNIATIGSINDIRAFLSHGDKFSLTASGSVLPGSNGDLPLTGTLSTSTVTTVSDSPLVSTGTIDMGMYVYPGQHLRLDGSDYTVRRTGAEVQTISVMAPTATTITTPLYKLQFQHNNDEVETTSCLAFNSDATTFAAALNGLSNVGGAGITVTRSALVVTSTHNGYVYSIYFTGTSVMGNVNELTVTNHNTVDCSNVADSTVTSDTIVEGGEVAHQRLTLSTNAGTVTDGTGYYKLDLGAESDCITWGASAAVVKAQVLKAGSSITLNSDDVYVSRGGNGISTNEIQKLIMVSNAPVTVGASGYFKLSFSIDGVTESTSCLHYGVSEEDLQTAIDGLSNVPVGHVAVSRSGDKSGSWGYGYEYEFNFSGDAESSSSTLMGNVEPFVVHDVGTGLCTAVNSGSPSLRITTTREGTSAYSYDIYFVGEDRSLIDAMTIPDQGSGTDCDSGWTHSGGSSRYVRNTVIASGGSDEVQTVTIKDATAAISSTPKYKLTFRGTPSPCIDYDFTAAEMVTALETISNLGSSSVKVSVDLDPISAPNGRVYRITFTGPTVRGNVEELQFVPNTCAANFATTTTVEIDTPREGGESARQLVLDTGYAGEAPGNHAAYLRAQKFSVLNDGVQIQKLIVKDTATAFTTQTYTINLSGDTVVVEWDATEKELEANLAELTAIASGDVYVTRQVDAVEAPNGYVYSIYFVGLQGDIDLLTVTDLTASSGTESATFFDTLAGWESNLLTSNSLPLASKDDAATSVGYLGTQTSLAVSKWNGNLWTIKFSTNLGDVPVLVVDSTDTVGSTSIENNFVSGSFSNSYTMSPLQSGIEYYARVAATTSMGSGEYSSSFAIIPSSTPKEPQNVVSGTVLHVDEVQIIRSGASHIDEVQVVTTSAVVVAEVQTITVTADACADGNCVDGGIYVHIPCVQKITVHADATITAGSYQLTFIREIGGGSGTLTNHGGSSITSNLQWDAQASEVAAALNALGTLDTDDVIVSRDGDASSDFGFGYTYYITFVGENVLGQVLPISASLPTSTCSDNTCTTFIVDGSAQSYVDTEIMNPGMAMGTGTEIQEIVLKADKALHAGGYKLKLDHEGGITETLNCISYAATASDVETELISLSNVDKVTVLRTLDAVKAPNGFVYTVFFDGNAVRGTIKLMTTDATGCDDFKTLENNVLTTVGVVGSATVFDVDKGGSDPSNTFFDAEDSTAEQLKTDLNRLPIFSGNVDTTISLKDDQGGYKWTIVFDESDGNLQQLMCTGDTSFGDYCASATLTDGNILGGSFILDSSVSIAHDAGESVVKAALEGMSAIDTVTVVRSTSTGQGGYSWTITFLGNEGNVAKLVPINSLYGVGNSIYVSEPIDGNYLSGTFTLTYNGYTTDAISFDAYANSVESSSNGESVQEKLQALTSVGYIDVSGSDIDTEGGRSWSVTFKDNGMNAGDLSLMSSDYASTLDGEGAVIFIREGTKGVDASGTQLYVSFDAPASDSGSELLKYQVKWDTSSTLANPQSVDLTSSTYLNEVQHITTTSSDIKWSQLNTDHVEEVQTIIVDGAPGSVLTLSFRDKVTSGITIGTTTYDQVQVALQALNSIGSVTLQTVTGSTPTVNQNDEFTVTFTSEYGNLPLLVPDTNSFATVTLTTAGTTSYRKKVVAFTCSATSSSVTFTLDGESRTVDYDILLTDLKIELELLSGIPTDGISIRDDDDTPTASLCSSPNHIYITFHRNLGDVTLTITPDNGAITLSSPRSIDGILQTTTSSMSGTFQLQYKNEITAPLSWDSSAHDVRVALENLSSITTVAVSRDYSKSPLDGKVDAVKGQVFVTCSDGETCSFKTGYYGVPGKRIQLDGIWYTVSTDTSTDALRSDRLYLADESNNEIGYSGESASAITIYEWANGFIWTLDMLHVEMPYSLVRTTLHNLMPESSTVVTSGPSCNQCYYIPTDSSSSLSMGETYYVQVLSHNVHGPNAVASNTASGVPRAVPNAPTGVDLRVVSGTELEIFFSPPALAPSNVDSSYNDDISSYTIQWDISSTFKHGTLVCQGCATALSGNVITVNTNLAAILIAGVEFTMTPSNCVYTVASVSSSSITVDVAHGCSIFSGRLYDILYYTYPTVEVSGLSIEGTPPHQYLISNLVPSTLYYVRVSATNSVPVQQVEFDANPPNNQKWSTALSGTPEDTVPDAPVSVTLYVRSGDSIEVHIVVPLRDGKGTGGAAITEYSIDFDTLSSFDSTDKANAVDVLIVSLPELYTGGPRIHYISSLAVGTTYYVQVKAKSSLGYSSATVASNPVAPIRPPSVPSAVKVSTLTSHEDLIDTATVSWGAPTASDGNGGLALTNYKVEWWTSTTRSEVQVVQLTWDAEPTGSFVLEYGGSTTEAIVFNENAENIRYKLMKHSDIGHLQVTRTTVNTNKGYQWSITFKDNGGGGLNDGDIPMLQFTSSLSGGASVAPTVYQAASGITAATASVSGTQEVQVIVTSSPTSTVTGYFRVSFKGSTWSNYINAEATVEEMVEALEQLTTVGQVAVSKASADYGHHWTITFLSDVGDMPELLLDGNYLTTTADDAKLAIKDGDNLVDSNGQKCLPGISLCPGSSIWEGYQTGIADLAIIGETAMEYGLFETSDATTLTYQIPNLVPGTMYWVTLSAKNSLGYGSRVTSFPVSIQPPKQVPGKPLNVVTTVYYGFSNKLQLTWDSPLSNGGDEISEYRAEWDTSANFDNAGNEEFICPTSPKLAVWEINSAISGGGIIGSGNFKLKLTRGGTEYTSVDIPWDAQPMASDEVGADTFCTTCSTGSMQSVMEHFSVLSGVIVTREEANNPSDGGYTWTITFLDTGDDFSFEATASDINISCSTCSGSDSYQVTSSKQVAGVAYADCTGTQVFPSVGSLTKGQLYYTRVFARNNIGYSEPAVAVNPEKPMVVPGLPTGVTVQVYSVTALKVIFSPPDEPGGDPVTEYMIEWATDASFSSPGSSIASWLSGGAPFFKLISELVQGTHYFVRVSAKNSQGYGTPQTSSPSSLNPHSTPSGPTQVSLDVTASSMLTVQWDDPINDGGDTVTSYVVEWDTASGFNSLESTPQKDYVTVVDVNQRSYTLSGLTAGRTYYVRVAAVNTEGKGSVTNSVPAFGIPANTFPGKPHTLTASATGTSGELLVSWQAPRIPFHGIPCSGSLLVPESCASVNGFDAAYGGTALLEYEIEWNVQSDFGGTRGSSTTTTTSDTLSLDANKLYYVRVLARNAQGVSPFCSKSNSGGYLCPDNLVLLSGGVVSGTGVSATTLA